MTSSEYKILGLNAHLELRNTYSVGAPRIVICAIDPDPVFIPKVTYPAEPFCAAQQDFFIFIAENYQKIFLLNIYFPLVQNSNVHRTKQYKIKSKLPKGILKL